MNLGAAHPTEHLAKGLPPDGGPVTVGTALRWGARVLRCSGSETPRLDAELLLCHTLSVERGALHVVWLQALEGDASLRYSELVRRRAAHEPVAYLLGRRAFYDVELAVDKRALIPRPETELLVDTALSWARALESPVATVADVGTGSGALAVALARHLSAAYIVAIDRSLDALRVASQNVRRYGLQPRVGLVQGDLLEAIRTPLDLIVANLPYVPRGRLAHLSPDVQQEPRIALDGGDDGLDTIRRLMDAPTCLLGSPGLLLLEIDDTQAAAVTALARARLPDARIDVLHDYARQPRVVRVERNAQREIR